MIVQFWPCMLLERNLVHCDIMSGEYLPFNMSYVQYNRIDQAGKLCFKKQLSLYINCCLVR